ncbi:hypothetical protein IQ227_21000 [Anabaena aphanizomenioides LEGE 00250]|uniref:Uncharacterized protein n=1 Tax=Sphaerospermopsis aphanizomenoides LEGE 00250 TaxID=2777972 RepID=A0ABR9VJM4_9CYAN|nr:hypothetical protein [Sphaerospermopsis aphanizomenoides]MBE9238430.1 hypothetical protein [Sphaerospermopsis aphanizomenoides LEGE 00250]
MTGKIQIISPCSPYVLITPSSQSPVASPQSAVPSPQKHNDQANYRQTISTPVV